MTTTAPSLLLLAALVVPASGDAAPESNGSRTDRTESGVWSEPVNGLAARRLMTLEEINVANHPSAFRYKVVLETRNIQGHVVAISSQPSFIDVETRDADGKLLPGRGYDQSGPIPLRQWARIPSTAYLGVRVEMTTVGLPGDSALVEIDGYVRFLDSEHTPFVQNSLNRKTNRAPTTSGLTTCNCTQLLSHLTGPNGDCCTTNR